MKREKKLKRGWRSSELGNRCSMATLNLEFKLPVIIVPDWLDYGRIGDGLVRNWEFSGESVILAVTALTAMLGKN